MDIYLPCTALGGCVSLLLLSSSKNTASSCTASGGGGTDFNSSGGSGILSSSWQFAKVANTMKMMKQVQVIVYG